MKTERHTLTPNEINKFIYCPYQWYYERLYGRKELERLAAERNERLGLLDKRISNFNRGYRHHNDVEFKLGVPKAAVVILFAVIVLTLYFILKVKNIV